MSRSIPGSRSEPLPPSPATPSTLLPLGALAAGFGLMLGSAVAQTAPAPGSETVLPEVKVRAKAETDKDSVRATTTTIGKGLQELRDVPQSITVVTERLIDDRNLDTMKDALRTTAGITFLAAEGAEEDIRLRGFSLQSTGDVFLDGLRDPGFYERDSFNWDRLEVLKGSASMLFGRGSTGGAVNQVSKQPMLINQGELSMTAGTGSFARTTLDVNRRTGENAAVRVNAVLNTANGAGNGVDKQGIAPTVRWGIGTADEFSAGLYYLQYKNGIPYGVPWLNGKINEAFKPDAYYGADSDYKAGNATTGTFSHVHRFRGESGAELRTVLRQARYERDQRASAIRFGNASLQPGGVAVSEATIGPGTVLTRGSNNKMQDMDATYVQSDFTGTYKAFGSEHAITAGVDLALEDFNRFGLVTPAGVTIPGKPTTTIGTPNDGGYVNESLRERRRSQNFESTATGLYAQDLLKLSPTWKLLGGVRWDRFDATYKTYSTADATRGQETANRSRADSLWSKRFGLLYQPTDKQSYHLSYGTSFNTSGDTYSFDALGSNTPPEKSRNVELGGSIDWSQGRFTTRFALWHATKYNERNRDEESVTPTNYVLSGERHAAGIDLDFAGRLTPAWEVFMAYSYVPSAKVDKGASDGSTLIQGERVGDRPAMTPKHSGSLWTTYRLDPSWRIGGGLNARSATKVLLTNLYAEKFVTADLMVEYTLRQMAFKLNVTNLADKLYAEELYRGHYIPGKGRTVQLTGSFTF
ncbi:TonB-dependent siderophore receptor [Piscinibacter sakaiensis]|uniref:Ferrichrome-iron receptor n=1 Tax=Piscinibacter sakaiensis TaxID=1547922 RepID=A0A0K8NXT4_PISS1|nr:TonB-dependent siderophore receptor [Piscinibacter sakaiensis]GAP35119.1 ferrichrome-iron receptor [Piscinibacter sakaiensis]